MPGSEKTKIWVISLAAATQRREDFARLVPSDAPAWEFFDAHTQLSPALLHDSAATRATHGRTLRGGELGCYSSHHALWQWLLDSDYDKMVVFEDDVQIDWSFLRFLIGHSFADMNVAYMRLFAKIPSRWRYVATPFLDRYRQLIRFTGYALGTQAYVLTRAGAAQFMQHAQTVQYPIDVFMDRYWQHGVPNLSIYPFPVFESFQPSSIGQARFEPERIPFAIEMQFKWTRIATKARMLKAYFFGDDTTRALRRDLQGRFSG